MIIWINGAFGSGKTQTAYELHRRIENSFVYDPEQLGYFISRNIPASIRKSDFQNYEAWRETNFSLIKSIYDEYKGTLIIPMTVVNPGYFNEIAGSLRQNGVEISHFTLMASKETLLKRLRSRGDGAKSWGAGQIDRCLEGLSNDVFQYHINTENMPIEAVAEKIAAMSGITLSPDRIGRLRRKMYRIITQVKHWRFMHI
jgi:cytidylate kinase